MDSSNSQNGHKRSSFSKSLLLSLRVRSRVLSSKFPVQNPTINRVDFNFKFQDWIVELNPAEPFRGTPKNLSQVLWTKQSLKAICLYFIYIGRLHSIIFVCDPDSRFQCVSGTTKFCQSIGDYSMIAIESLNLLPQNKLVIRTLSKDTFQELRKSVTRTAKFFLTSWYSSFLPQENLLRKWMKPELSSKPVVLLQHNW